MWIQINQIKKMIGPQIVFCLAYLFSLLHGGFCDNTFTKDDIDIIAYRAGLLANITWIGGMVVLCVIIVAMFAILLLYIHSIMTKQRSQNNGNQPTNRSGAGGAQTSAV
uniref:Uncharacterized protein n=1 Tax=Meloidogyne enterolobii TaxID=390850 RepID=A0A6V7VKR0_MELEN|nr:unnamed protein product [Meloidogyne enterolobii]